MGEPPLVAILRRQDVLCGPKIFLCASNRNPKIFAQRKIGDKIGTAGNVDLKERENDAYSEVVLNRGDVGSYSVFSIRVLLGYGKASKNQTNMR
jgi:hypothetical protein